jgi:uncharacterized protein
MKVIDLNLLIYAVNRDAPLHERARKWWESCLSGKESIGLPWIVLLGFLRITTHPGIMPAPLSPDQAMDIVDTWLAQEPVKILNPTDRHWDILKQLIRHMKTASNMTTDAHIAALALETGGLLYSSDNDFSRFPNLEWKNPIA